MHFQGAIIEEQRVKFAVVIVKEHVLQSTHSANEAIRSFKPMFPALPVILMAQDHRGVPSYYGRKDISSFLAKVPLRAIPWREYTYN